MTEQRRIIASALSIADDHPDAEAIHMRASQLDNRISLSTIYRTLSLFTESGIIETREFRGGRARYEDSDNDTHDHLIDLSSGEIIEFINEEITQLQEGIANKLGSQLVDYRLELYGRPLRK